jgi:hypothetical protein
MKSSPLILKVEIVLYGVIFLLAAGLRLGRLDMLPLSDTEAVHALAAAQGTPHQSSFWIETNGDAEINPADKILTSFIFQLCGATDATARLLSVLAGTLIVGLPLLVRKRFGRSVALFWSLGMAISPILMVSSRTAGGSMLAAFATLGALILVLRSGAIAGIGYCANSKKNPADTTAPEIWENNDLKWAGVLIGIALVSGRSAFIGFLGIGLGLIASSALVRTDEEERIKICSPQALIRLWWLPLIVAALLSTGFGLRLEGIADWFDSIAGWIKGWSLFCGFNGITSLVAMPIYEPFLFAFGIGGLVMAFRRRDPLYRVFAFWLSGALLVQLLYTGRSPSDLVWVVIPLSLLAAMAAARAVEWMFEPRPWPEMMGLMIVLLVFAVFAYLQIASYASGIGGAPDFNSPNSRLQIALAALGLAVIVIALFGMGWGWKVAGEAATLTGGLILLALTISTLWHLNFTRTALTAGELLRPIMSTEGMTRMVQSIEMVSQAHTGTVNDLAIQMNDTPPPSLAWAIRNFKPFQAKEAIDASEAPLVLARKEDIPPRLSAEYIGQSICIRQRWGWSGALPPDLARWWVKRWLPTVPDNWLLLVQTDLAFEGESEENGTLVEP